MAAIAVQPIQAPTPSINWKQRLPKARNIQRCLLIATVGFAIVSAIPPLRLIGALGMRSISLLSAVTSCAEQENVKDWRNCALRSAKIGVIALGLAGVITATPLFIVISIVADMILQIADALKAASTRKAEGYTKACAHLMILAIDAIVLAAILTGMWQVMVAAAAVGVFALILAAVASGIEGKLSSLIDCLCYSALSVICFANTCLIGPVESVWENKYERYSYVNKNNHPVDVRTPNGNVVHLAPGETYEGTFHYKVHIGDVEDRDFALEHHRDLEVTHLIEGSPEHLISHQAPANGWLEPRILRTAMEPEQFSTVFLPNSPGLNIL